MVVLIHPTNLQAASWAEVIEHLPGHYDCVAVDLSGHGQSSRPGSYGIAEWAEESRQLMLALGLESVHLVGASIGAAVAIELAVAIGDQVRSITTVGGAFQAVDSEQRRDFSQAIAQRGAFEVLADVAEGEPVATVAQIGRVRADLSRNSDDEVLKIWEAATLGEVRSKFSAVRCPTLAIVGALDEGCPPEDSAEFAAATGGKLVVLPGIGHLPMYTVPEETSRLIGAHLDRVEQQSSGHTSSSTSK